MSWLYAMFLKRTLIHNIELNPYDGGKLVRASGSFARVISKTEEAVRVELPSKKEKLFFPGCRAGIGVLAGSGRIEKPFLKAGTHYHKMRQKQIISARMRSIHERSRSSIRRKMFPRERTVPTQSPRSAPPGRKVGKIAPRRTGRRKK